MIVVINQNFLKNGMTMKNETNIILILRNK